LFLVVGLGNPGPEYAGNRHNLGFMVVDEVARRMGAGFRENKTNALIADIFGEDSRILLAKPQTFMNVSGRSVRLITSFFKIPLENILIVHDELDLPYGAVRLKDAGGHAGHNGLRSIIDELGTGDFKRVRVGIGRPPGSKEPAKFVLEDFTSEERRDLDFIIGEAADIVESTIKNADDTQ
jgi:peptidyl-tRNA hydrolase, PTH1 family